MNLPRLFFFATLISLAGCGSSPQTHYYTLAATKPGAGSPRRAIDTPVTVSAVNIPSALDRDEIVRSSGVTTVDVSDQNRWIAPVADMTRRVLSQDLAARLPPEKVILPNSPLPPGTASIVVSVSEFGPKPDGRVVLNGSWSLIEDDRKRVMNRVIGLETHASGGIAEQADDMSRLLGQLASQIADALPQFEAAK